MIYWGNRYETFFDTFLRFGAVIDLRQLRERRVGNPGNLVQLSLMDDA